MKSEIGSVNENEKSLNQTFVKELYSPFDFSRISGLKKDSLNKNPVKRGIDGDLRITWLGSNLK